MSSAAENGARYDSQIRGASMILETERLILRKMTMDDEPALAEIVCDEQTMYAFSGALNVQQNRENLEKQLRGYREDGFGRFAVVLKETKQVIGLCGPQWCDTDKDRVLEIGYFFNRAFWHKGYAAEAAAACKHYAFDALGFDEVFSLVRDTNIPSMNVAIRNKMFVRGRYIKREGDLEMPHYIFSARKDRT
jgi:RimJ/RimL family protein N-acetyltransferase